MAIFSSIQAARAAVSNYAVKTVTGGQGAALSIEEAAPFIIELAGAITANINVTFPVVAGDKGCAWVVYNATSGAFTLTVKGPTGTGVAVTQGKRAIVVWDGTNFVALINDVVPIGAAAAGANTDITALSGIVAGITMAGGLNLSGQLLGNASALRFGYLAYDITGSLDKTLLANEYNNRQLNLTGNIGANISVILPLAAGGEWVIKRTATGAFTCTIKGSTGTGVDIAIGKTAIVRADGTNIERVTADNP